MAVVINGSGTVTGLSVGGLPDGTVDAGTLADDAVGLAQMASGTDGNLITYDASGNPAAVAVGTSGQVLTSNGAGAAPTMQAGGKVLRVSTFTGDGQQSFSNQTTYTKYDFDISYTPTNSDCIIEIEISATNGGSTNTDKTYLQFKRNSQEKGVHIDTSSDNSYYSTAVFRDSFLNGGTSSVTYEFYGKLSGGSNPQSCHLDKSQGHNIHYTIKEISNG